MAGPLEKTMRHLQRLVANGDAETVADRQLLSRYVASKDESAFAALMHRHGPMVLGVCRRVLSHPQDAEDACQATFLVLARKAASIHKRNSIRCWLHGVAFRVASNLRRKQMRRKLEPFVEPAAPAEDITLRELQRVLDEELLRLPEHFRLPLLLCYLEGKTRDEAAEELGWRLTTFKGRLERGRERLRFRLERKGIGLPAALLATLLFQASTPASVPAELVEITIRAAVGGSVSPTIISLAEGAIRTMFLKQMKLSFVAVLAAGMLGVGGFLLRDQSTAEAAPVTRQLTLSGSPVVALDEKAPVADDELTEKVKKSREAAIGWLKKAQKPDGTWESNSPVCATAPGGATALATLALLDSGLNETNLGIAKAVQYLRDLKPDQTYVVALRAVVLCRANNLKDAKILQRDVDWLADAAVREPKTKNFLGWGYKNGGEARADFSNTHYAVMALQAAHEVGVTPKGVPAKRGEFIWLEIAQLYWRTQLPSGGWPYATNGPATHSMTVASLAGLIYADSVLGKPPETRKYLNSAFAWIGENFSVASPMSSFYNLHAVARLGKNSGKTAFGKHDWFREGAKWLLEHQKDDGSFSSGTGGIDAIPIVGTSFALLFLNAAPQQGATPKPPEKEKEIDLGKDKLRFYPVKEPSLKPGLYAIGMVENLDFYPAYIYQQAVEGKAPEGAYQLIGLMPGVHALGDTMETVSFVRNGATITAEVKHTSFSTAQHVNRYFYLHAPLPKLPPGKYTVNVIVKNFQREPGDKVVPVKSPEKPVLTCMFTVPGKEEAPKKKDLEKLSLEQLAGNADQIVVATMTGKRFDLRTRKTIRNFEITQTVKNTHFANGWLDDRTPYHELPEGDGKAWILFLRADESDKLDNMLTRSALAAKNWFLPYDEETLKKVKAAIPLPAEWGRELGGLRIGMRLRQTRIRVGEEVAAEIVIQNVSKQDTGILGHRFNIYDFWPNTRFEVAARNKGLWMLEKPVGDVLIGDYPRKQILKPGECSIEKVRLNRWPAKEHDGETIKPNLFAQPGSYIIRGMYDHKKSGLVAKGVRLEVVADPKKVKDLRENLDTFMLRLNFTPGKTQAEPPIGLHTLDLHVANLRYEPAAFIWDGVPISANARITKAQAGKIIDALAKAKFFDPQEPRLPGESKVHHVVLTLSAKEKAPDKTSVRYWWNDELLEVLKSVRACVDGGAGTQMDTFMKPLADELKRKK